MPLVSIDPATGATLRTFKELNPRQLEAAVGRAHAAYAGWSRLAMGRRADHLRAVAAELRRRTQALARLATAEMGKPVAQGRTEVEKCATAFDFYAAHGARLLADEPPPEAVPGRACVVFRPLGVVLAVMPWNFPYWQVFRAAAPALMAGNTVLLKHASNVTGCALAIERVFRRAGLPAGVFQTLPVGSPGIEGLVRDPRVRGVTLTGSVEAGRKVAALAGAALKKCVLELGGSDPYVVLADADLARAAEACAAARLINSGQSCIAGKRFIVAESVRAEFEALLVARMAARRVGDPRLSVTDVGPLAREDLRAELHSQVRRSVRRGARLLLGGRVPPGPGWFYPPTVLTGVRPGMPVFDEEVFGPVAAIVGAVDEAEAIRLANATPFGLGAAVFTRDVRRGERIAREEIDAGVVFVNDFVRSQVALPFGGVKDSGFGRELGAAGIREFVNLKTVANPGAVPAGAPVAKAGPHPGRRRGKLGAR